MAIVNQPGGQADQEIGWAAVTGMLNLRDVLQLVVNRLDDSPFTQQDPVSWGQRTGLHVSLQPGNQLKALFKQLGGQFPGNIAPVPKQPAW